MPYVTTHTKTINGKTFDIIKLINIVRKRKPVLVKLPVVSHSHRTGFSQLRYSLADPNYPILILKNGTIVDGRHRVCKLQDRGINKTLAIIVTSKDLSKVIL